MIICIAARESEGARKRYKGRRKGDKERRDLKYAKQRVMRDVPRTRTWRMRVGHADTR